jgi:hypothetical protein
MGALFYHSYADVVAEKQRVNGYVSSTVVPAFNNCSPSAQLQSDWSAWYSGWQAFTVSGEENYANLPDNDEWDTMQEWENSLAQLVARLNQECGSSAPVISGTGNSPSGTGDGLATIATAIAAAVSAIAIAVVAVEVIPIVRELVD